MSAGTEEATEAPPKLRREFWLLVGIFKVALLASALGVLLVVFDVRASVGIVLVAVGIAAFSVGVRRCLAVRADPPWEE